MAGHAGPTLEPPPLRQRSQGSPSAHCTKLKAIILLAGSVRPTPLRQAIRRSVLDLPVDQHSTILTQWLSQARSLGISDLPVYVLLDPESAGPTSAKDDPALQIMRDISSFRGSGGVLRDMLGAYHGDDRLLVAAGSQILFEPLADLLQTMELGGDVAQLAHRDGTPGGLLLIKAAALGAIPAVGFIDLKEQALPTIARRFDVRVVDSATACGMCVRTLGDYIAALRQYHRRLAGKPLMTDPLSEDWKPSFGIIEDGAHADPTARVHDSVVLRGGTVHAGAIVVRSVVCEGAAVGRRAVEQWVRKGERQ